MWMPPSTSFTSYTWSASVAGPLITAPLVMSNREPWHWHMIVVPTSKPRRASTPNRRPPGARKDEHVVEVFDSLDPVRLGAGKPQEVRKIPLGLRTVFVLPTTTGFHDANPVTLLRGAEGDNVSPEARADDGHVVVEAHHALAPSAERITVRVGLARR